MTDRKKTRAVPAPPGKVARSAGAQAEAHQRTRQAHAMEIAEDYLETIVELIELHGEARTVDIARRLGVSHVTVVRTLSRLQGDGYLTTEPYRSIFPTDKGRDLARSAHERHQTVLQLLEAMGVSPEVAEVDAEGIEHHLSRETLVAFQKFLKRTGSKKDSV